jgi:hypothetical protein
MDYGSYWQSLGIDRAAYHQVNLNGKNVQQMFQESDIMFSQFQELLLEADEEDGQCNNGEGGNRHCPLIL